MNLSVPRALTLYEGISNWIVVCYKGLFQMFAILIIIPFSHVTSSFPSCGMYYYIMNIYVSILALIVYICVARRYKYRKRDEICDIIIPICGGIVLLCTTGWKLSLISLYEHMNFIFCDSWRCASSTLIVH